MYEEAQQLVAEAENEEATVLAGSEILGSQIAENEEAIAQLEEQLRQDGIGSGSLGNIGSGGLSGTGSFLWPMPGYAYLTCYFGEGGHRGIDIAGGDIYGKAIVAADGALCSMPAGMTVMGTVFFWIMEMVTKRVMRI